MFTLKLYFIWRPITYISDYIVWNYSSITDFFNQFIEIFRINVNNLDSFLFFFRKNIIIFNYSTKYNYHYYKIPWNKFSNKIAVTITNSTKSSDDPWRHVYKKYLYPKLTDLKDWFSINLALFIQNVTKYSIYFWRKYIPINKLFMATQICLL